MTRLTAAFSAVITRMMNGWSWKTSLLRIPIGKKPWLWQKSLPDEKKNSLGLFITDETLNSVCLIYKAPDDEIVYRYLDADGNTRSALRDFFEDLAGQLQTEGKRGDA